MSRTACGFEACPSVRPPSRLKKNLGVGIFGIAFFCFFICMFLHFQVFLSFSFSCVCVLTLFYTPERAMREREHARWMEDSTFRQECARKEREHNEAEREENNQHNWVFDKSSVMVALGLMGAAAASNRLPVRAAITLATCAFLPVARVHTRSDHHTQKAVAFYTLRQYDKHRPAPLAPGDQWKTDRWYSFGAIDQSYHPFCADKACSPAEELRRAEDSSHSDKAYFAGTLCALTK